MAVGGLALFMFGLQRASEGLKGLAGGRMRVVMSLLTGRRMLALLSGAGATFLLQSTTAAVIMLVGLTNVGLLTLQQAAGMAVGGLVGSTIIVQVISFDVAQFALFGVALGLLITALSKNRRARLAGSVLTGFGFVFFGIFLIRQGLEPLRNYPQVVSFLGQIGTSPGWFVVGVAMTALFSVVTQSSAATMAVAFGLARAGAIGDVGAMAFIFGAHIATFVTPLLAGLGAPRTGRQLVLFDFAVRLAGLVLFLPFTVYIARGASAIAGPDPARMVAWGHTIFNVANALVALPFLTLGVKLARRLLPVLEAPPAGVIVFIDPKLNDPAPIALDKAAKEICRLGHRVADDLRMVFDAIQNNDLNRLQIVAQSDDVTDAAYEIVTDYLLHLPDIPADSAERDQLRNLLYILKDIEHVGDVVSKDLVHLGSKKESQGREFSIHGSNLMRDYHRRVHENYVSSLSLIGDPNKDKAREMLDNEAKLEVRRRAVYDEHLEQIRRGVKEAQETSSIYTDMLAALQQVTRYAAEIGETVLASRFDTHAATQTSQRRKRKKR